MRKVLAQGGLPAEGARQSARAWWRRMPTTVDRYLEEGVEDVLDRTRAGHLGGDPGRTFRGGFVGLSSGEYRRGLMDRVRYRAGFRLNGVLETRILLY